MMTFHAKHNNSNTLTGMKVNGTVRQKRTVSFSRNNEKKDAVQICSIPSRFNMSEKEISDTWYSDYELKNIRRAAILIIRKMITASISSEDNDETRGLENKTPMGSASRKENRFAAMFAVLNEQDRQREEGRAFSSDYIALLYYQSSAHCQTKALQRAEKDAKIVMEEQERLSFMLNEHSDDATQVSPMDARLSKIASSSSALQRPSLSCLVLPRRARSRRRLLSMLS